MQRNGDRRLIVVQMYGTGDLYPQAVGLFDWGFEPTASSGHLRERAHRERAEALDGGRRRGEPRAARRQRAEVREVLDDVHAGAEQQRVRGPLAARLGVVDVERVDADEHRTGVDEPLRALAREERRADAVLRRAEPAVPAGVQQHGRAAHVAIGEGLGDGCRGARRPRVLEVEDLGAQPDERRQVESREVAPVGVAVERRVEVGAGVADHRDDVHRELGARRVLARESSRVRCGVIAGAGRPG